MPTLTPLQFIAKWRQAEVKERSAYQSHFLDLCMLVGHRTPIELDPKGTFFTFEAGASKVTGGEGFADVWFREHFAWEYKGKHANLEKAYQQLLQYREALQNPPLLVVSDIETIQIHTNFTNTIKRVYTLTLDDLGTAAGLQKIHDLFHNPQAFQPSQTPQHVTEEAARHFAQLAERLRSRGAPAEQIAHFLIQLLFTLFAEDVDLLPNRLLTRMVTQQRLRPDLFNRQLSMLFSEMATGGFFGPDEILHFDGRLFENGTIIPLDSGDLAILAEVGTLDWANIQPSIFGTLFERSLDPSKRSQLGAHYTSEEDILLIVEPVLMAPLRREWESIKTQAHDLIKQQAEISGTKGEAAYVNRRRKLSEQIGSLFMSFAGRLASMQVLDPACGSGNFLYLALRRLLDLWKEVSLFAGELGVTLLSPQPGLAPSPEQLHGIEINEYAHQLAQATIWIGYIQWLRENGFDFRKEPVLHPLDNILHMDAILALDENGRPYEPEWPQADVIIGNPPFLGDKKMRGELGDEYVTQLRELYRNRVPGGSDLVTYWFEKSRALIAQNRLQRAGLIATNSIRQQGNRQVLQRIKDTGDIFFAWSDRPWILDGAAVRVSIIGFDNRKETQKILDGKTVLKINADLSSGSDVIQAKQLEENRGLCFLGMMKAGPFDIDEKTASILNSLPANINGRLNTDVVKPRITGKDITGRCSMGYVIDFGEMPEEQASLFEAPFEHVKRVVKPVRDENRRERTKRRWWLFGETRPGLRQAMGKLTRCIVTPEVAKHRIFVWMPTNTIPDHKLHVIARDDDLFFGILHSSIHEKWSLAQGSWMGVGNDPVYSSSRTFETFPFPWPPGKEPQGDPLVEAIAQAARELVQLRDNWLNPPGASEAELKKRTLTNLYNQRPTWLQNAHRKLDQAVFAAYGWPHTLSDDEILERLLALNLKRAAQNSP